MGKEWAWGWEAAAAGGDLQPGASSRRGKKPEKNLIGREWAWGWDTASVGTAAWRQLAPREGAGKKLDGGGVGMGLIHGLGGGSSLTPARAMGRSWKGT